MSVTLEDISDNDIDVLLDALETWENKDLAGEMMGDIFTMIMQGDKKEGSDAEQKRLKRKAELKQGQVQRKNQSVILRAKLLTLRSSRQVAAVERAVNAS